MLVYSKYSDVVHAMKVDGNQGLRNRGSLVRTLEGNVRLQKYIAIKTVRLSRSSIKVKKIIFCFVIIVYYSYYEIR